MNSFPNIAKSGNSSPITPIAPVQSTTDLTYMVNESEHNAEITRIFEKLGYQSGTKISDSLQGSIWRISKTNKKSAEPETAILKVASKELQKHKKATLNGKTYNVKEDIISEQRILKYLTEQKDCPDTIIKYYKSYQTDTDLLLYMEDGGGCLFDFVQKSHSLIKSGNLDVNHWKQITKIIFKQMIETVTYMHSLNIVHMDLSLENWLIEDPECNVKRYSKTKSKMEFVPSSIKIKLCDFGLAEIFPNGDFRSNKWCGKTMYQSPEVRNKNAIFDAKKNDIWCLGLCCFALCLGCFPWYVAEITDEFFSYVMSHSIVDLLVCWNRLEIVDQDLMVMMDFMLKYENNRIDLSKIKFMCDQIKIN